MATRNAIVLALSSPLLVCVVGKDPSTTPMNRWPMIMAHDAATTYLNPHPPATREIYRWTITQPSQAGTSGLLDCGVRAFDWRPMVDSHTGGVVMHHGPIEVNHPMKDAMAEVLSWSTNRSTPDDFVVVGITDCQGPKCEAKVQTLLADQNISYITDCSVLQNMTMSKAMKMGALANGGHVLALFSCWEMNYDPSIACTGHGKADDGQYDCWNSSRSQQIPLRHMYNYLNKVEAAGPPADGMLYTAQMLWQESDESVVIGTLKNSSLLEDERQSGLNWKILQQVRAGNYTDFNLYEINNACDGGPELHRTLHSL